MAKDQEIGSYDVPTAEFVLRVAKKLQQMGFVNADGLYQGHNAAPLAPIYFRNDASSTVPSFGCLQAREGTVENTGQNYVRINQPNDVDGTAGKYLFNGPEEVPPGEFGVCFDGVLVRCLSDGSTATAGDRWAPVVAEWYIEPAATGPFVMAGPDDIRSNVVRIFIGDQGSVAAPRVQFYATGPNVGGITPTVVYYIEGNATQPGSSDPLTIGQQLNVHDPRNEWPVVDQGCYGWATLHAATPATPKRYEVDHVTELINELSGEIKGNYMKRGDSSAVVTIQNPDHASSSSYTPASPTLGGPQNHVIKGHHTSRVWPPEIDFAGQASVTITGLNRESLHGKGECTVFRTNNAKGAMPLNVITPHNGAATDYEWRVTWVKRKKAAHVEGKWKTPPSPVQIDSAYNGEDPRNFGSVAGDFDLFAEPENCPLEEDDPFTANYNPEDDNYRVIVGPVGLMTEPDAGNYVDGGDSPGNGLLFNECNLEYRRQPVIAWLECAGEPSDQTANMPLTAHDVVDTVSLNLSNLKLYFGRVKVYVCKTDVANPIEIDLEDCPESSGS